MYHNEAAEIRAGERPHKKIRRQLGIPLGTKIPMTLLRAIISTLIGKYCHNPTKTGDRRILVTRLVKKRAVPLLNADVANR
jgi:hypothetical protein